MDIKHYNWKSENSGLHLLITGVIHGNEVCGYIAISWLKELIDKGLIKIVSGELTVIPMCNPKAYEIEDRYFESNLNRNFYPKDNPVTYEDKIQNIIAPFFQKADVLLDIHSYHKDDGAPFMFFRPDEKKDRDFASMLGVSTYFCGFADAYLKAGISKSEKESMGTREYILTCGGYGVTLECGYHKSPNSIEVAKKAIMGALYHLGVADIDKSLQSYIPKIMPVEKGTFYKMIEVFYKKQSGALGDFNHLQQISKGEILASYEDGTSIKSPYDGYMIFPNNDANIDDEWFYIAEKVSR